MSRVVVQIAVGLVVVLAGCVDDPVSSPSVDGQWDSFSESSKADSFGVADGSSEALGVLALVNSATLSVLDDSVGLDGRAARAITTYRAGDDGALGSFDDVRIDTLSELDSIAWVGANAFARLLAFAGEVTDAGMSASACGADEPLNLAESSRGALGVLSLVSRATPSELDNDVGLDARAANSIVAFRAGADRVEGTADDRSIRSIATLDGISYVGASALNLLLDYASRHGFVSAASCGVVEPSSATVTGFAAVTTVWTIVLENHDYAEVVGSSNAPYINSLIDEYGLAANYRDSGQHPSLPNYLYMISGDTQYHGANINPTEAFSGGRFPVAAPNLGAQLEAAGITWRSYQESMGTPCRLTPNSNHYAPKHDPFLYFDSIQNGAGGLCARTQVDYSKFAADLASGAYRYMWITPNLVNDGHDPSATVADVATALRKSDTWCASEVPKIMASEAYKAGGVIFLTWDEAEGRGGRDPDQVPMIVISPLVAHRRSTTAYSHASYLATVEDIFGLTRLGDAVGARAMAEFSTRTVLLTRLGQLVPAGSANRRRIIPARNT